MEGRRHFLANACHVCKSKVTPVVCEVCRMVFYCSPGHRREDWLEHSEICWALSKICGDGDCLWGLLGGQDFTKFRHGVAARCTELLKRSLKPWEMEMIYHPRVCAVCREYDWARLSRCKECDFVFTCGRAHFREDHGKWCRTLKLYSDIIVCQSLGEGPKPSRLEIKNEAYKSMSEVLEKNSKRKDEGRRAGGKIRLGRDPILKGRPRPRSPWQNPPPYPPEDRPSWEEQRRRSAFQNAEVEKALTSEVLTYPLTVAEGLKATTALRGPEVEVLFVGAEVQAEVEPLYKWEKYLLHRLEGVRSLKLTFLGPELGDSREELSRDLCETCRKGNKTLKFEFVRGRFYHEYSSPSQPHLICAFNSGMYREFGFGRENSWEKTILKLFGVGRPPVLVSEYTRRELEMVLERIGRLCGEVGRIVPAQKNPFASLKPGLNILSEEESPVIFKNYYYAVLQKVERV